MTGWKWQQTRCQPRSRAGGSPPRRRAEAELLGWVEADAEHELLAGAERRLELEVLEGGPAGDRRLRRPEGGPAVDPHLQPGLHLRPPELGGRLAPVTPVRRHLGRV